MPLDCAGESYDPRLAACCEGILHRDVTPFDECCGEITYSNRKYICCDDEVFSKEERKDCYAPAPERWRSSRPIRLREWSRNNNPFALVFSQQRVALHTNVAQCIHWALVCWSLDFGLNTAPSRVNMNSSAQHVTNMFTETRLCALMMNIWCEIEKVEKVQQW